jgi:simple sugar transport system ATP-binding protein
VLFVSHKLREILDISEKVTILRNGRKVIEGDVVNFSHEDIVYHMTGRSLVTSRYFYRGAAGKSRCLLSVQGLNKAGSLDNVSFSLYRGEIVGVTGLLGSGRTELALALFGLISVDSGHIRINEEPVEIRSVSDAMRNGIAYVPEDRLTEGLFPGQSVKRNIVVSILRSLVTRFKLLNHRQINTYGDSCLEQMRIKSPSQDVAVESLSGGNQQKVVLARWLATDAQILILNGPTVGVDIGSKIDIHAKIKELAKRGVGVIIASDDTGELINTCSRILFMHKGQIVDELMAEHCEEDDIVARLGELK